MPAKTKMTAAIAADVLGINRTRTGDLAPMAKALRMMSALNTPEENARLEAVSWALRHWKAYQDECQARRDRRTGATPPLAKAVRALLAEVDAWLDAEDDEEAQEAADAVRGLGDYDERLPELAAALLEQVDAHLDYETDADMQRAADDLRELLPAPAAVPGR